MSMSQVEKKDKKPVEITHDFYSKKSGFKNRAFYDERKSESKYQKHKKSIVHEIKLTLYFFNFNITLICFTMIFP